MKKQNGITLIALVITIVVLLILAGVSLATLTGENGVLIRAQGAVEKNEKAEDKEQIMLAMESYAIDKKTSEEEITLAEVIKQEAWCRDAVYDESTGETIVTIDECGHQYKVESDGTITLMLGVLLNKYSMTLELEEGSTITDILKATLYEVEGNITWTNSDDSVATISTEEGEDVTVTAVAEGNTTVTATCGEYEATCKVTVKKGLVLGSYVKYNVPYADLYTSYEFNETTGWRYIGKDASGNKLIISTGIPAKLYYESNVNEGKAANGWWGTDAEVTAMYGAEYSANGFDKDNGGYPNRYAAVGLLKHFESIPYTIGTYPRIANTMEGTVVGNGPEGPLGPTLGTAFRANDVSSKIVDVHNLSLTELNRALNREETSTSGISSDTTGVFNFEVLDNYGYTSSTDPYYWLAAPVASSTTELILALVDGDSSGVGVRPVVTLDSSVELIDTDGDGVFEIK